MYVGWLLTGEGGVKLVRSARPRKFRVTGDLRLFTPRSVGTHQTPVRRGATRANVHHRVDFEVRATIGTIDGRRMVATCWGPRPTRAARGIDVPRPRSSGKPRNDAPADLDAFNFSGNGIFVNATSTAPVPGGSRTWADRMARVLGTLAH